MRRGISLENRGRYTIDVETTGKSEAAWPGTYDGNFWSRDSKNLPIIKRLADEVWNDREIEYCRFRS